MHLVHLLTGLTIFADWLGSNIDWFPLAFNQAIDPEKLAPLNALGLTVVKIDKPNIPTSRLTDFHTIGGGMIKRPASVKK